MRGQAVPGANFEKKVCSERLVFKAMIITSMSSRGRWRTHGANEKEVGESQPQTLVMEKRKDD